MHIFFKFLKLGGKGINGNDLVFRISSAYESFDCYYPKFNLTFIALKNPC